VRALLLVLIGLALTGCGGAVRQLNPGAAGVWRVSESLSRKTDADFTAFGGPERSAEVIVVGWCDHVGHEIRLSSDRPRRAAIADSWHELGHRVEREFPGIWDILDAMDTPDFPCGSDELHATQRAIRAAAAATMKGQP
jgi:hypothetical protein